VSLVACDARVLRTHVLGETSLIVVLLTPEAGIVRAVAKGARETKSRFRGLLESGWPLRIQYYDKARGLRLLKDAVLRGSLPQPSRRLETWMLRLAAIELVLSSSREEGELAGLYELLEEYLGLFDAGDEEGPLPFFAFEAGLLSLHGLAPSLERCGICGRTLETGALRFLPSEGVFACRDHASEGIDLASEEGDWLKSVFLGRPARLQGRDLPESTRHSVARILHLALSRHLPGYRLPRSLGLLKTAKQGADDDAEREA